MSAELIGPKSYIQATAENRSKSLKWLLELALHMSENQLLLRNSVVSVNLKRITYVISYILFILITLG